MTAPSIVAAHIELINDHMADVFRTVADIDTLGFRVQPNQSPAALIQITKMPEKPLSFGYNLAKVDVDVHLFFRIKGPSVAEAERLKLIVSRLRDLLKSSPHLHENMRGTADVPGQSKVLSSGRVQTEMFTRPILSRGGAWEHALVSNHVEEIVNASTS